MNPEEDGRIFWAKIGTEKPRRLTEAERAAWFSDGDQVRTITHSWAEVPVGSTGYVVKDPAHPLCLSVMFDHDPVGDGSGSWAMLYCQIEHVSLFKRLRTVACEHATYKGWRDEAWRYYQEGRLAVFGALELIRERIHPNPPYWIDNGDDDYF